MNNNSQLHQEKILDFSIEGMTCASCVRRVEKAIRQIEGVDNVSVNLTTEQARIFLSPEVTGINQLVKNIETRIIQKGYKAYPLIHHTKEEIDALETIKQQKAKQEYQRLIVAVVLALPLLLSMILVHIDHALMLPGWLQFLLATPIQFWLGARFYVAGYKAIRSGAGNMDVLVALGSSAAWGLSTVLLVQSWIDPGQKNVPLYFESSALIITFILFGQWLEHSARRKAALSVKALQSLQPDTVHHLQGKEWIDKPLENVQPTDMLVVLPGETIPADGKVMKGASHVDEAMLTGESKTITKHEGDGVTAGTINLDGSLVIEVIRAGNETRLAGIVRMIEAAQASKAPIQKLVDKVSAIFVPIVIVISVATFFIWWMHGAFIGTALMNAASVMVIACPCALGLATPTALAAGSAAAARAGILVRDAEAFEIASNIKCVAFDKTGTLTEGQPGVSHVIVSRQALLSEQEMIHIIGGLSTRSEHPLAKAVVQMAHQKMAMVGEVFDFSVLSQQGRGVKGRIDGHCYIFGNAQLMVAHGIMQNALEQMPLTSQEKAATLSYLAREEDKGRYVLLGVVVFEDQVRAEAAASIRALHDMGIETFILTGDGRSIAEKVGNEVGIKRIYAELSPEEKLQILESFHAVSEEQSPKKIAMIGDGLNDAPALVKADLGIAMGSGTDAAREAANVTLMRPDLALVPDTFDISLQTTHRIREGLFWAFAYNVIGIPLAALGYLNPSIAGGAMALSSVCVVANALRLLRWKSHAHIIHQGSTQA